MILILPTLHIQDPVVTLMCMEVNDRISYKTISTLYTIFYADL